MALVLDSVELFWQRALAGSTQLAFVLDSSRRIVAVSAGLASALGVGPEELLGHTCISVMHGSGNAPLACALHDLLLDGGQHGGEVYSEALGRRLLVTVTPLPDEHGRLVHVLHVATDVGARTQTEEALRESEARYRSLFENSPVAMWEEDDSGLVAHLRELAAGDVEDVIAYVVADPDEYARCLDLVRLVDVNWAAVRLFGANSRGELLERAGELYRDQAGRSVHRFWAALLAGEGSASFEEVNVSLDGRQLDILETCTVVPGHQKSCDRVYVADVDISEPKRAERALREAEARYRAMFEENRAVKLLLDPQTGAVVDASPSAADFYGYPRETLRTMAVTDIAVPPEGEVAATMRSIERGEVGFFRSSHRLASGEVRDVEVSSGPITVQGRSLLFSIVQDVTERRCAELALREREAQLVQAQRIAGVGHYVLDLRTATWTSSAALDEILGIDPGYVRDENGWFALIHPDERALAAQYFAQQVRRERRAYDLELRIVRPADGGERSVHCVGTLKHGPNGELLGMFGVMQDVTARCRDREELRRNAEYLRQTVEGTIHAMGQLVESRDPYTAGHERRVAVLVGAIAERLGWNKGAVDELGIAAFVHDIGKIAVPAEILNKPGRLSQTEFALIRSHPRTAHEILAPIAFTSQVAEIVLQHHERLDGSGYPRGLRDGEILPAARVLAIADVVEAMTSHRPYRPALAVAEAVVEIRAGLGSRYDREAALACLELLADGFAFPSDA